MAGKTTDTREKLLDVARKEFLEFGYEEASLRRMAKAVGIAAPSVYNHFSSKEEIFSALVEPVIQKVADTFRSVDGDKQEFAKNRQEEELLNKEYTMSAVLDFIYDNLEDVKLLLFSAAGTKYENILDRAAEIEAEATFRVMKEAGYGTIRRSDREAVFLLMRHQYQTYAEAIRLGYSKKQTKKFWSAISDFYNEGWRKLLKL